MRQVTLVLLMGKSHVWLAQKKRGFGKDFWNGYGGKVEDGESIPQATVREVEEEAQVQIKESALEHKGVITFVFENKVEWNQVCSVFTIEYDDKDPVETEEMRPEKFELTQLPYDQMWPGDEQWLPSILRGEYIEATVYFDQEGAFKKIEKSIE